VIWIHIIWTILLLLTFVVIVVWAWSSRQKVRFDQAANIPLQDEVSETQNKLN